MPKDQMNSNPNQKNDSKPEMSKQNTRDKSKPSSRRNFSSTYQFPEIGKMVLKPSYVGKYGDIESCFLEQSASVCAHLGVSLVTPMARDKWIQEIQQFYTTITAKYTGRVEFTAQDLERYIVNVRAVRAELLDARKLYCLLNTREYNSTFFKDLRTHLSAWTVNPIVLADFYNQMRDDLLTSFPLKLEVLEQDLKMISFLYKDARVNGSTYYDFAPAPVFVNFINDAYVVEGANVLRDTAYRYNNASNTLSMYMTAVRQHIDKMTTAVNASIAAAIRATFLDDRNTEMPVLHVGDSIEIKFDKLIGLAISNGVCGQVTLPAIQSDGFLGWTGHFARNSIRRLLGMDRLYRI